MTARFLGMVLFAWALASSGGAARADGDPLEPSCRGCHARIYRKKVVHAALQMPCSTCHDAVDTRVIPHKPTGPKGRSMTAELPALCLTCHDGALFEGPRIHAPVAGGQCLLCHDAHSSDQVAMLKKPPAALCLDCHGDIGEASHVLAGTRAGHPLGREARKGGPAQDPLRPGRPFYCVGCHEPHRGTLDALARVADISEACPKCHRM